MHWPTAATTLQPRRNEVPLGSFANPRTPHRSAARRSFPLRTCASGRCGNGPRANQAPQIHSCSLKSHLWSNEVPVASFHRSPHTPPDVHSLWRPHSLPPQDICTVVSHHWKYMHILHLYTHVSYPFITSFIACIYILYNFIFFSLYCTNHQDKCHSLEGFRATTTDL